MTNLTEAIQNACEIARRDERRKFKEYLEKKNTEISNAKAKLDKDDTDYMLHTLKSLFIDEIIEELFGEESSDRDE